MMKFSLETDKSEPAVERVTRLLRQEIISGTLKPGERVVQDAVARRYNTSRIPVREAMRALTNEGLLTYTPDVGSAVAPLDVGAVIEVYRIRESLEQVVVAEAVRNISNEQIDQLVRLLDRCEANQADHFAYLEHDRSFHFAIFEASNLPRFVRIIHRLWDTTRQFRALYMDQIEDSIGFSDTEHRMILDAIERRSPEDAASMSVTHMRRLRLKFERNPREMAPAAVLSESAPRCGGGGR